MRFALAIYALLMILGGIYGYYKSKSLPSIVAGCLSGALLFFSLDISLTNPQLGFTLITGITILLVISFAVRLKKTKKFMPSGMLLILSLIACLISTVQLF